MLILLSWLLIAVGRVPTVTLSSLVVVGFLGLVGSAAVASGMRSRRFAPVALGAAAIVGAVYASLEPGRHHLLAGFAGCLLMYLSLGVERVPTAPTRDQG